MKKILIMTVAMSAMSMANAGQHWAGFYAGLAGGVAMHDLQLNSYQPGLTSQTDACHRASDFTSLSSGALLGYTYQFANLVVSGVEADFLFNSYQNNSASCYSTINSGVYDRFTFQNQMQATIKGRVGRALIWHNRSLLPYLTAGVGLARFAATYTNEGSNYYSTSNTQPGWLLGAGIEWAFLSNWSLRAEYDYTQYGSYNLRLPSVYGLIDPDGNARFDLSTNHVFIALNYWVN